MHGIGALDRVAHHRDLFVDATRRHAKVQAGREHVFLELVRCIDDSVAEATGSHGGHGGHAAHVHLHLHGIVHVVEHGHDAKFRGDVEHGHEHVHVHGHFRGRHHVRVAHSYDV